MMVPHRLAIALQERGWWVRSDIVWHKPNPMPESVTDRPTKAHEYIFLLTKNARYYYDADAIKEQSVYPDDNRKLRQDSRNKSMPTIQMNGMRPGSATYPTRNRRSVWTITTKPYSGAHFATFPPEIPEICIKAGTSEKGQCPVCGSPWVRVVNKPKPPKDVYTDSRKPDDIKPVSHPELGKVGMGQKLQDWYNQHPSQTTGWQPTCEHDADPVPQIVLDTFNGSGTTVAVAQELGRIGFGLDLSWEYLQLARERTGLAQMDAWINGVDATEENWHDLPMFSFDE